MSQFQSHDIYQFALRIEENGERFYRRMSQCLRDPEAQRLFSHLADEELSHRGTFETMLFKMDEERKHFMELSTAKKNLKRAKAS